MPEHESGPHRIHRNRYATITVGGGVIGAAIAHALARRLPGPHALFERDEMASGATGLSGAMVRVFHGEPWLSDLALEGLAAYRDFEAQVGEGCGFRQTGSLYFDRVAQGEWIALEVARLNGRGANLRLLDASEGRALFPHLAWATDDVAIYEADAGYVDPVRATRAWLRRAEGLGVTVREHTPVEEVVVEAGRVVGVRIAGRLVMASAVIVASGVWFAELLAPLGLAPDLFCKAIQLEHLTDVPGPPPPCFLDRHTLSFGRPDGQGGVWVGVGLAATQATPGPLVPNPIDSKRALALAAKRLPAIAGRPGDAGGLRTLDAYSADRRGLFGFAGNIAGLYMAVGGSGTGFKIAPALAERAAAAIATTCKPGLVGS